MENVKKKLNDFIKVNDNYKTTKLMCLVVLVVMIVAYNKVFTCTIANPDGMAEGFYYYINADWASAGCGRWFVRYYNGFHANVTSPVLELIEYMVFNLLTTIVVVKLLKIKNKYSIILTTVLLSLTPTIISQLSYTCISAVYSLSGFLASLYVYFNLKETKSGFIIGTICLAISLAAYQSYVGYAAVLALMTLVIEMIKGADNSYVFKKFGQFIISAIIAFALYYGLYQLDLCINGLVQEERVAEFQFGDVIKMFPIKFFEVYKMYFVNFIDKVLKHKLIYSLFFVLFLTVIVLTIIDLIKKDIRKAILFVIGVLLIPFASNIIGVLIPMNPVKLIMSQQNWLIFPFALSLLGSIDYSFINRIEVFVLLIMAFLSWTYIISANATYSCYDLSYKYINNQMNMVMNRVYDIDEYEKDKSKIVMIGFPDETHLRETNYIYRLAVDLNDNVAFWTNQYGLINCRRTYFMNMLGVDPQEIDINEYEYVVTSEKVNSMPCWPKEGSVDIFDGYIVVKFANDPIYSY